MNSNISKELICYVLPSKASNSGFEKFSSIWYDSTSNDRAYAPEYYTDRFQGCNRFYWINIDLVQGLKGELAPKI
jgi:hypothetical protein